MNREKVTVQDALDVLVSQAWGTEGQRGSSENIYALNKNQLKEIEDFLRQPGNGNANEK